MYSMYGRGRPREIIWGFCPVALRHLKLFVSTKNQSILLVHTMHTYRSHFKILTNWFKWKIVSFRFIYDWDWNDVFTSHRVWKSNERKLGRGFSSVRPFIESFSNWLTEFSYRIFMLSDHPIANIIQPMQCTFNLFYLINKISIIFYFYILPFVGPFGPFDPFHSNVNLIQCHYRRYCSISLLHLFSFTQIC